MTPLPKFLLLAPIKRWLGFAWFLSFFINFFLLTTPIYMMQVFDRVLGSGNMATLGMLTLITVTMVAAQSFFDLIRSRLLARAGYVLEQDMGPRVLNRVHDFQLQAQSGRGAELMRDVSVLRNYISSPHLLSIFDSPWAPAFTALIFAISWVLGVVTLIGIAVLMVLALIDERVSFPLFTRANIAAAQAQQMALTSVRNAEIVHALGMKPTMLAIWEGLAGKALGQLKYAQDRSHTIVSATKATRTLIQVAMLGVGAWLVISENMSPGIMIAATIIVARAIGPVETMISGWKTFIEARNAYERLETLLIKNATAGDKASDVALPEIVGAIEAEHVSFGFGPNAMLFSGVSIRLEPGQALGLVGASGSGKSTLARILLGLLPPIQGKVRLDNYDVNHYERSALGKQLGYLPQDVELFAGTLAQNIARMQDPAEHSEEITRVTELVGLAPLVARFPEGFQARLTEGGLNLSGGQRQLVGLARALFGSPKLVVLDEPDANLDQSGKEQLLKLLNEIREQRETTLIVISHTPAIVDRMDRLLLLQDGAGKLLARQAQPVSNPAAGAIRLADPKSSPNAATG
ncbi:MAG: type I secretion system permease/ATPase [Sulfuritalea sp.]|nr:type I secretion system permease/ATPase [Sulfuritalea sp.]